MVGRAIGSFRRVTPLLIAFAMLALVPGQALAHHEGLGNATMLDELVHNVLALNVLGILGILAVVVALASPYAIFFLYRRGQKRRVVQETGPDDRPLDLTDTPAE